MTISLSDSMRSTHFTVDAYGSIKTAEKTNVIDLKAVYGMCKYRDCHTEEGTGTVTHADARYCLSISGATDKAGLVSTERGTYVAGFASECGIGLDADAASLTGNQLLEFGYFDDQDGYFFRVAAAGELTLHVRKGGVTYTIEQDNWNGDYGRYAAIDFSRGTIWHIQFTYYGFGSVLFSVVYSDEKGAQMNRLLHSYASTSGLSCLNPNLPIAVVLSANGTEAPFSAYVGGRQFSVQGTYDPRFRVTQTEESVTGVDSSNGTYVVSFNKLPSHRMCAMKVFEIDVVATGACFISILTDTVLTDATYEAPMEPVGCVLGVSGMCRDKAATAVSGGLLLYTKLVGDGYTCIQVPTSCVIDDRHISVTCRAVAVETTVDAVMVIRIKEYF